MPYLLSPKQIEASNDLCISVLSACGGAAAIANSLGCDRQRVRGWMSQGYVPLIAVYDVSSLVRISPWILSYCKLTEVFGEASPDFAGVVYSAPLTKADKERIVSTYNGDTQENLLIQAGGAA